MDLLGIRVSLQILRFYILIIYEKVLDLCETRHSLFSTNAYTWRKFGKGIQSEQIQTISEKSEKMIWMLFDVNWLTIILTSSHSIRYFNLKESESSFLFESIRGRIHLNQIFNPALDCKFGLDQSEIGLIRIEVLDWTGLNRIYLCWSLRLNRNEPKWVGLIMNRFISNKIQEVFRFRFNQIESDLFSTDFHRTRFKTIFG